MKKKKRSLTSEISFEIYSLSFKIITCMEEEIIPLDLNILLTFLEEYALEICISSTQNYAISFWQQQKPIICKNS